MWSHRDRDRERWRNKGHDDVVERVVIATLLSMAVPRHKIFAHSDGMVWIKMDMWFCVERRTSINHRNKSRKTQCTQYNTGMHSKYMYNKVKYYHTYAW